MSERKKYSLADIRCTLRSQDAWWQALVVDPIAVRVTWWVINFTKLTPNMVTLISFLTNVLAAILFANSELSLGAVAFFMAFLFDCVDGKIARAKKLAGKLGQFLDVIADLAGHALVISGMVFGLVESRSFDAFFAVLVVLYVASKYILTYQYLFEQQLLGGPRKLGGSQSLNGNRVKRFMLRKRLSVVPGTIDMDAVAFVIFPLLGAPIHGLITATTGFLILTLTRVLFVYRFLRVGNNKGSGV